MQEDSPDLARYMQLSQREASADVVNASILTANSAEKRPVKSQDPRPPPPQVSLPKLSCLLTPLCWQVCMLSICVLSAALRRPAHEAAILHCKGSCRAILGGFSGFVTAGEERAQACCFSMSRWKVWAAQSCTRPCAGGLGEAAAAAGGGTE